MGAEPPNAVAGAHAPDSSPLPPKGGRGVGGTCYALSAAKITFFFLFSFERKYQNRVEGFALSASGTESCPADEKRRSAGDGGFKRLR